MHLSHFPVLTVTYHTTLESLINLDFSLGKTLMLDRNNLYQLFIASCILLDANGKDIHQTIKGLMMGVF